MKEQMENSHEGITGSEMGKKNVQAKVVYFQNMLANMEIDVSRMGIFDPPDYSALREISFVFYV